MTDSYDATALRKFLTEHFDVEELRTLCQDIGVDFDALRGEGKEAKARELVAYMQRHARVDDIVAALKRARRDAWRSLQLASEAPAQEGTAADDPGVVGGDWIEAHVSEIGPGAQVAIGKGIKQTFVLQIVGQAGVLEPPARNLPAQLASLRQVLPHLDPANQAKAQAFIEELEQAIAALPAHEQAYRERVKTRYSRLSSYFVELVSETAVRVEPHEATPDFLDPAEIAQVMGQLEDFESLAEFRKWEEQDREIRRVKLESLRAGVEEYPCIVLLGDPGAGKTTALQHLADQMADESGQIPVPLRLSEFLPEMSLEEFIDEGWGGPQQTGHWGAPELVANLEGYLEAGRLFFLFDALNEMPRDGYSERVKALRGFINRWLPEGNRFLVTCRVLDYGEELAGLQRVEVQPFNDEQIQAFLQKVLDEHWRRFWQPLTAGSSEAQRLLEMARNPYLLRMMLSVFLQAGGQLTPNRGELMTRFTEHLWRWAKGQWAKRRSSEAWLDADVQREALSVLAFEMQRRKRFGASVKAELARAVMPEQVRVDPDWPPVEVPPERVLTQAASANLIVLPEDRSSVRFYHHLLQEYFAARHMLKQDPAELAEYWRWPWLEEEMPLWERPEHSIDPLPPPPPTRWEETTVLAAGLAPENDDQLVRALIQVNPVLAGRCLDEGQAQVAPAVRQAVSDALLATIADPKVALRVRIAAGEVLGYLGDPRLGELVTVPAGKFLMGSKEGEFDEQPQHELHLPAYQIGKYPVTNVEYERFMVAGGYGDPRWWTEAGWHEREFRGWTEPEFWQDTEYNKPNQPVIGVCWYEAIAYCRWRCAETGRLYRLPSEAEWEKAARGTDGRIWPWGDEFEPRRLNSSEGKQVVRIPTPVGIYPDGVSPCGAYDCAGNVGEWTRSRYRASQRFPGRGGQGTPSLHKDYPYDPNDGREDLEVSGNRALRGGSFDDDAEIARCASRYSYYLHGRFYFGIRIVAPPFDSGC